MLPILFMWGEGALYTYTTLFSVGIMVGGWLWVLESKKLTPGVPTDAIVNAIIAMFLLGILGAKLLFIVTNLQHYRSGLFQITKISSGGIVFYGGFIGGLAALLIWIRRRKLPYRATLNAIAPGLAIGHAIGRLGCFAHGCCHGAICHLPWGVSYQDPRALARPLNVPLHPTQLYEVLGLALIGGLCLWQNRKHKSASNAFKYYLLSYASLRFFVEFFRADTLRGAWAGLSTSQWVSIVLIICCLFLDFAGPKSHNSAHENRT
jgi:phosphatidylglycerol---prolipoprotein diacylglyceryl transferase